MENMENKLSILVLGSKGHALADTCIGWGDDFYVGDYDILVVSLKTLTPEIINRLRTQKPDYLENIRKQIVEAQQEGLKVFCILEPFKLAMGVTSGHDEDIKRLWNNYSWCPIIPKLERVSEGKKIDTKSSKIIQEYLNLIKGWSILWEESINNTGYLDHKKIDHNEEIRTRVRTNSLLNNIIGRYLSFEVGWRTQRESTTSDYVYATLAQSTSPIVFYPQVENSQEAVDIILGELCGQAEELPPDWISKIKVSKEEKIDKQIENIRSEIATREEEIQILETEINELNEYKKLLYASGYTLEYIVEKSFGILGINIISPAIKNKEDRLFNKDDASIPIEIRGKNAGLNEKDLNQLTSRFVDKPESAIFKTRGLFVLNHFRELEPENRGEAFNVNTIDKAIPWRACLVTTKTIFELIRLKLHGREIVNLENLLFNTLGVFELPLTASSEKAEIAK